MDITGQRVVLFGGTSGIGLATAKAASARGAHVVVVSGRQTSVDRALEELPAGTEGYAVDLNDTRRTAEVIAGLGPFDHFVWTAGDSLSLMPVSGFDIEKARSFFELRFFSMLAAVAAAAPLIRSGGSITLTTGTAKDRSTAGWALAAGVCGAVESVTKALAVELAPVRVNAVAPGVLRSPLWSGMSEEDQAAMYKAIGTSLPVGRVGETDDAADAFLYLLSQPYSTGTVLTLDGGTVLV